MKTLIIDISAASFPDYVRQYGMADGILYGMWYRVVRPALVMLVWLLFCLYIYHSLVMVGGTAAQVGELLMYSFVVAAMAGSLVAWMIVCRFHNWIRMRDREEAGAQAQPPLPGESAWRLAAGVREVLVHHDERGAIDYVVPWDGEVAAIPAESQPDPVPVIPYAAVA